MWKVLKQKSYRRKVFLIKNCYRREKSKQNTCFYVFKIMFLSCVVLKWPLPGRSNAMFSFPEVIFEDFLILVSNSMTLLRTFIVALKNHSQSIQYCRKWLNLVPQSEVGTSHHRKAFLPECRTWAQHGHQRARRACSGASPPTRPTCSTPD